MNKFNLVFDINFHFNKTLHVAKGYEKLNHPYLSKQSEREVFFRKVTIDFLYSVNLFKGCHSIISCQDSKSWRKKVNSFYKANRTHSSDIDWEAFYGLMDEFQEFLKKKNVIVSRIDDAEADDLIYLWSKKILSENENTIILSGDSDLHQLVECNNKGYVICFNGNSKVKSFYAKEGFLGYLDTFESDFNNNIFDMDKSFLLSEDPLDNMKEAVKQFDVVELNPKRKLFEKILLGDKSDNILPIYSWMVEGKLKRVTNKYLDKIMESVWDSIDGFTNLSDGIFVTMKNVIEKISNPPKAKNTFHVDLDVLKSNYYNNLQLIYLDKSQIPKNIIKNYIYTFDGLKEATKFDLNSFIQGTKYEKLFQKKEYDMVSSILT